MVGSLKFDAAKVEERRLSMCPSCSGNWASRGRADHRRGSTHAGEEAMLGRVFKRLQTRHPKLFLVVVPRHHERGAMQARRWRPKA